MQLLLSFRHDLRCAHRVRGRLVGRVKDLKGRCGAMTLKDQRKKTVRPAPQSVLFIFSRSTNRSDSMQLRVIIGFKKIYLMPMMACPVARRYVPQFHVKVARKNVALGRATSWNFFGGYTRPGRADRFRRNRSLRRKTIERGIVQGEVSFLHFMTTTEL